MCVCASRASILQGQSILNWVTWAKDASFANFLVEIIGGHLDKLIVYNVLRVKAESINPS